MSEELIHIVVTRRQDQAAGIAIFDLARPDGGALPLFDAGAHIDVQITPDLVRQYSLCNPPGENHRYRIGVLDDPASRGGSKTLHALFQPGFTTQISAPRNHFPLVADAGHSVLIGGGIGITPMIAMAYALKAAGRSFELHYCSRSADRAGFLDELRENFAETLHLHFDDGAADQRFDPLACLSGRARDTHAYVCGPSGFMDWVIAQAKAAGLTENQIHFEYFNATIDSSGAAFEVEARRSKVTVTVAEGQSIIDALAQAGVKVKKSCEQGVCGTCLCDVIDGIPDHKDKFLNEEEKDANDQIVLCCSRSKTPRLVLDL